MCKKSNDNAIKTKNSSNNILYIFIILFTLLTFLYVYKYIAAFMYYVYEHYDNHPVP